jgi:hypothetical protein
MDPKKAQENLKKHKVSFDEAVLVFADPFALTFDDPDHSADERRFITIGTSSAAKQGQTYERICHIQIEARIGFELSMPGAPLRQKPMPTKNHTDSAIDELRPEYDLSSLKGRVRGKYYGRATAGTTLVLLEADVAEAFPTGAAVNRALRALLRTTRRKTSKQSPKRVRPTAEGGPRSKRRRSSGRG